MKRNKIFRWLYFIILLIPIMFVFLPMINNKNNSFTTNYEITTNKNIVGSHNFLDLIVRDDNIIIIDNIEYYSFSCLDSTINKLILHYIPLGESLGFSLVNRNTDETYFFIELLELTQNEDTGVIRFTDYFLDSSFGILINFDGLNRVRGFYIPKSIIDAIILDNDYNNVYFNSYGYEIVHGHSLKYNFLPFYYETTYELQNINASIWYDFSVKMNDTFTFIGGFTEFVSDNIIDLSNNDYVFFAFTYMVYIFVVSLLWLLFEFLMFIINFTHKYMERFYE